ncbi:hypothetical protein D3C75_704630 [compost metagenome]
MKPKAIIKIGIDLVMTILLLILMAFMLTGQKAHEWFGAAMIVMFITHNILNFKWYKNLLKGRYTPLRIVQTIVNFAVLLSMIGLMVSGIMMSGYVFAFLSIKGGMSFARELHMLASYWGYIFMSLHLGLHWNMIMNMVRKTAKAAPASSNRKIVARGIATAIAAYGVYAIIRHDIASYLFMKNTFIFFDFDRSPILFFAEYLAMMGLWVYIAYYGARSMMRHSTPTKRKAEKIMLKEHRMSE